MMSLVFSNRAAEGDAKHRRKLQSHSTCTDYPQVSRTSATACWLEVGMHPEGCSRSSLTVVFFSPRVNAEFMSKVNLSLHASCVGLTRSISSPPSTVDMLFFFPSAFLSLYHPHFLTLYLFFNILPVK
jgi:hypothetical protein